MIPMKPNAPGKPGAPCKHMDFMPDGERKTQPRFCADTLMFNHFHMVFWPPRNDQLSRFTQWLNTAHTQRRDTSSPVPAMEWPASEWPTDVGSTEDTGERTEATTESLLRGVSCAG